MSGASYAPLGALTSLITKGTTPKTMGLALSDAGIPFLRAENIRDLGVVFGRDPLFIDEHTNEALSRSRIQRGDVLVSIAGTIGRVGVVPDDAPERMNCNQAVAIVRVNDRLDARYLAHWLTSDGAISQIARAKVTATISNLSLGEIAGLAVPWRPLPEQRRVAAILDKAAAIRRKRREAIALTDELLRSAFLEMFGDPVSNPKGWPSAPLGTLARFIGGGTPTRQNASYFTGDLCWATPKDMRGEVLTDTEEHITELALRGSAAKVVPPDTLLVVVKSKVLAHRLPVARTTVRTCFGQDLKGICLNAPPLVRYVHRHLLFGQSALLERARGLNTEGLTLEHLREYEVMLPPDRLVSKFTEIERRLEGLLHRERNCLSEATSLCDSLSDRAFSGEL